MPDLARRIGRLPSLWPATAVLLLSFALAVTSLDRLGPTFDEQGFLVRGLAYLRGENRRIRVGHPLGLNALNAALLVDDPGVRLPTDDPSWSGSSFHRPAELFLWEIGNDVEHIMFLSRLPTIWLLTLLAALVGRWTWAIARRGWAALLALTLVALDPNMLAHGRLATTDLGLAAFSCLAAFTLWRYWRRPSVARALGAGVAFGLLQNTKFTAGLFVPLFALVMLIYLLGQPAPGRARLRAFLLLAGAYLIVAPLTLWAAYAFQVGTLPDSLPTLATLGGMTLPLAHHLEQLLDIGGRLQQTTPAFLAGRYGDSGWWYYFPVAFLLKTPLPVLLLMGYALFRRGATAVGRAERLTDAALLVPALGYLGFALTTDINLGYRHLLPVLPLLYVFTGAALATPAPTPRPRLAVAGAALWLVAGTLLVHPFYLAFFNALAGGPDGGWRYLVDSNLDWGQDLGNLADWLAEREVDHVWLGYFGEARPDYYGIVYTGLDSWPPRLMNPAARPFYPADPAPGVYALSATALQGVHFTDHDRYAWFRGRAPLAKIGYSIFVYEVEERGTAAHLALGSLQLDEILPDDFSRLGGNDVTPRWFDAGQSLLSPGAAPAWLALGHGVTAAFPPERAIPGAERVVETGAYTLYRLPPPNEPPSGVAQFENESGSALLSGHDLPATTRGAAGETLAFTTVWRKDAPPQPLRIFIHLTDAEENIVAQWDGLGAIWQGWRAGDTLWQWHTVTLPPLLPPDDYEIRAGLYNPESGRRWRRPDGREWVVLGRVAVAAPGDG